MIKFYRVSAFRQIGGFVRMVMWDGIDCHRCRMLGWQAAAATDADTRFVHLRPMGTSTKAGGPAGCGTASANISWALVLFTCSAAASFACSTRR
jgi:hypothetical protein